MFVDHDGSSDPRKKRATLEDIQPALDEVVLNVRALAEPGTSFYIQHSDDARNWADVIQNHIQDCCAFHKVDSIAEIRTQLQGILRECEGGDCPHDETHAFLRALIESIDKPMSRLVKKLMLEQMLHDRTN